jgi:Transcriptional Coactivator p15 (PC4)
MNDTPLYEKIISENEDKGTQLRLVVSEFKGEYYIHLRKYFLSYEGDFVPTKEGASFPATIQSIFSLLDGLIEICSKEESIETINKYFSEKLECLKSTNT